MKRAQDNRGIKDPAFRIPEGYFETLPDRLQARIAAAESGSAPSGAGGKVVPLRRRHYRWAAAAAAIVLLLGIGLAVRPDDRSEGEVHHRETHALFGIRAHLFFQFVRQPDAHLLDRFFGILHDFFDVTGIDHVVVKQVEEIPHQRADQSGHQHDEKALRKRHITAVGLSESQKPPHHYGDQHDVVDTLISPAQHADTGHVSQEHHHDGGQSREKARLQSLGKNGSVFHV